MTNYKLDNDKWTKMILFVALGAWWIRWGETQCEYDSWRSQDQWGNQGISEISYYTFKRNSWIRKEEIRNHGYCAWDTQTRRKRWSHSKS